MPDGNISFHRRCISIFPKWKNSSIQLSKCKLLIFSEGSIEDSKADLSTPDSILEVDFANKMIGGGVLDNGLVQEEIRFLISPELIVSRLFTERLADNECLIITGPERLLFIFLSN